MIRSQSAIIKFMTISPVFYFKGHYTGVVKGWSSHRFTVQKGIRCWCLSPTKVEHSRWVATGNNLCFLKQGQHCLHNNIMYHRSDRSYRVRVMGSYDRIGCTLNSEIDHCRVGGSWSTRNSAAISYLAHRRRITTLLSSWNNDTDISFLDNDSEEKLSGSDLPRENALKRPNEMNYSSGKQEMRQRSRRLPKNKARFRQHVNPLAQKFQQPCNLPSDWPSSAYHDTSLPLHLDIGCGKGGFLLELSKLGEKNAAKNVLGRHRLRAFEKINYLGLEIRPMVAEYAQKRILKYGLLGRLCIIGCNANVELERILLRYQPGASSRYTSHSPAVSDKVEIDEFSNLKPSLLLKRITIQFPDPQFKLRHKKRGVVNAAFVQTIANHTRGGAEIYLASDIKDVLDDMRCAFRQHGSEYFTDCVRDLDRYIESNPIGVPTEREVSVLKRNLPVYRSLFVRNDMLPSTW